VIAMRAVSGARSWLCLTLALSALAWLAALGGLL
jgi:hypothetical protein